jgi:peptidoglycan hydrolase-like protein with peptidoglycan-binding domain
LTASAVSAFQNARVLNADGIVGDATWPALLVQIASGSTGDAVRAVQSQLNSRSGQVAIDGVFGPDTDRAIQLFQTPIGLAVDGIVNWYTWHALLADYLRIQNASDCVQSVFEAWTTNDQVAAGYNATPNALSTLFARPWNAADGWAFDACGGAAGSIYCTWNRPDGSLILGGPDPGGGLYVYVNSAKFQP